VRLLVATTSLDKLREIRAVLGGAAIEIVTLADVAPMAEPVETGATFWENARLKALTYSHGAGLMTVAEDSGIEIDALGGEPGIRSARFLGAGTGYADRFAEIYRRLAARPEAPRDARFVTAMAVADGDALVFETETRVEGVVAPAPAGDGGFGYDPIFHYPPFGKTTAEMTLAEKLSISHRARAFRDLGRALLASTSAREA
jgi:XTP/dITP diphosphohydrolase